MHVYIIYVYMYVYIIYTYMHIYTYICIYYIYMYAYIHMYVCIKKQLGRSLACPSKSLMKVHLNKNTNNPKK
jgi:hypothetical protein